MGVKKSTVWTKARSRSIRYTPASSAVADPTRRFESRTRGRRRRTCARARWLSFEAQPAQEDNEVSLRICSRDTAITSSPNDGEWRRGSESNTPPTRSWRDDGFEDRGGHQAP